MNPGTDRQQRLSAHYAATATTQLWRFSPSGVGRRLSSGLWTPAPHLDLLSSKFVDSAFGRNRGRLIVTLPPRHGKSEHSSHYAPVWYLDQFPERRFTIVSYGAEFSQSFGVKVRDTIEQNPGDLTVRIRPGSRSRSNMLTTRGGGLYAIGVGGQLTGRGTHGLGIDDVHKDWEQANSIIWRDKVWNWYTSTARTRLDPVKRGEPRPFVVISLTRWHEDDIVGRLIEAQGTIEDGGLWEVIRLPAIAEDDDPIGREPGEALWPEAYPLEGEGGLLQTREEVGEFVWGSLYQQHPSSPAGTILLRKWWKFYEVEPRALDLDAQYMSWDMTFDDTENSDFVVGQVWGIKGANRFLLDQVRDRMSFTDTIAAIVDMTVKWPRALAKYVEKSANGPAVINTLQSSIPGLIPITAEGSKESRAHAVSPYVQAGNVYLPSPNIAAGTLTPGQILALDAPYRGVNTVTVDFIRECAAFPKGPQDDQVDAFTQAMLQSGVANPALMGNYQPNRRRSR